MFCLHKTVADYYSIDSDRLRLFVYVNSPYDHQVQAQYVLFMYIHNVSICFTFLGIQSQSNFCFD